MNESATIDGVKEYTLESWFEFFALARDFFATAPAFVYRGQANYEWPLRSSLDRLEQRFPKRKNPPGNNPPFFNRRPLTDQEHLLTFI
jgi:hypothetical protein